MRISWIVPTYNEERVINDKLENLINFCKDHPVFYKSEIVVADNGSIDNTVYIAKSFEQVTVREFGRIGKYQAVHRAVAELDSDWVILSDANVTLCSADSDSLRNLFHMKDVALIYGIIRRDNKSYISSTQKPFIKTPKRLILDACLGLSSGAYGGLYAVKTSVLKKVISLPPVQNDDYFIAVSASQYGVPRIGNLYAEEIEPMTFQDEFKRKMRDAQGHIHAVIEINRRVKNTRFKYYGISIRLLIDQEFHCKW